jgi:chromosome segregation ATPase
MQDETPGWAKALETGLSARLDTLVTRMDGLASRMDGLATRAEFEGLANRIDGLASRMDGLATRAELNGMRADIMDRIDRLQDALAQQQTESAVNYASADRVREMMRSTEDQISAMMRMIFSIRTRLDEVERKLLGH